MSEVHGWLQQLSTVNWPLSTRQEEEEALIKLCACTITGNQLQIGLQRHHLPALIPDYLGSILYDICFYFSITHQTTRPDHQIVIHSSFFHIFFDTLNPKCLGPSLHFDL